MGFQRHEFNTTFEFQGARRPLRYLTEEQAKSWDEQGFFVMEDAMDRATVDRLVAAIDPFEQQGEAYLRSKGGRIFIARADEITFTTNLAMNSPEVREFVTGPVFQHMCYDLIGPDVRLYWDMAVYKKPGVKEPFPWHQDNGYTYVDPQQYVTCWVALTDATLENGCPWVVPGAHRQGTFAHKVTSLGFVCTEDEPANAISVPVKAGSIVVMSSLAPHATGANVSNAIRKALIAQFVPEPSVSVKRNEKGEIVRTPCEAPRNFRILRNGEPGTSAAA